MMFNSKLEERLTKLENRVYWQDIWINAFLNSLTYEERRRLTIELERIYKTGMI